MDSSAAVTACMQHALGLKRGPGPTERPHLAVERPIVVVSAVSPRGQDLTAGRLSPPGSEGVGRDGARPPDTPRGGGFVDSSPRDSTSSRAASPPP
ncbi:hypothetical protein THAOC_19909, partial [Thalassiosira oceanica]